MRSTLFAFFFVVLSGASLAQDPGMLAAQQAQLATQQAELANQQAIAANQAAMAASQQATAAAMAAAQAAPQETGPSPTLQPTFSLHPGSYASAMQVRLKTKSRGARIYYTTDGWTPTLDSTLYTGPITIDHSETIQAIALSPGSYVSAIAKADYTIASAPKPPAAVLPISIAPDKVEFAQNTPLNLVFLTKIDSQTANVGDVVPLALASDLIVDGKTVAPKGSPAKAKVTAVDPAGHASLPGVITFSVESIRINGVDVPLSGTRTRQGPEHPGRKAFLLIPAVGVASLLKHGDPAEILPNTEVTATVATNTEVPAQPAPFLNQ
jgi:hypothetical protein